MPPAEREKEDKPHAAVTQQRGRAAQDSAESGERRHTASFRVGGMFDLADLITLPGSGHGTCGGVSRKAAATESFFAARDDTSTAAPTYDQNNRHVIDACAMASNNVALAMSDGELCHAKLSQARVRAAKLVPTEEQRWPLWNSWPSRHGKVHSLQYDPAHDALVTIEARARSVLLLSSWVASFLIQQLRLIARQVH